MAINPNTAFTAGQILTADQQNRFPRGVMSYNTRTTSQTGVTTEVITITGSSFTAAAGRLYKVTYFEPDLYNGGTDDIILRIRKTNISGAIVQTAYFTNGTAIDRAGSLVAITTFSAGTANLVATIQCAQAAAAGRGTDYAAYLIVEDIGAE